MARGGKMHLAQFLTHGPTYHSLAMWRHPKTDPSWDWARPGLYEHIARTCERGLFDMVFFADLNYISDTYQGSLEPSLRYAVQAPEHDPVPLLGWLGAVTERIGLAATFSVSNQHPFYAARLWATLDHMTSGRVGWNVVTSINSNQAANYGVEREATERRYERAHEYMQVCRKLWNSWDEDAVLLDREGARFADASKVRRIEHEGEFFRSRGPLNVVRSPQNGPAILQAGTSPGGRDFAARYADAVFAIQAAGGGRRRLSLRHQGAHGVLRPPAGGLPHPVRHAAHPGRDARRMRARSRRSTTSWCRSRAARPSSPPISTWTLPGSPTTTSCWSARSRSWCACAPASARRTARR